MLLFSLMLLLYAVDAALAVSVVLVDAAIVVTDYFVAAAVAAAVEPNRKFFNHISSRFLRRSKRTYRVRTVIGVSLGKPIRCFDDSKADFICIIKSYLYGS